MFQKIVFFLNQKLILLFFLLNQKNNKFKIKNPKNLEKVTRILFSNRRKMINKNFKKLFKKKINSKNLNLNLNKRPEELNGEMFYKIAMKYEKLFN